MKYPNPRNRRAVGTSGRSVPVINSFSLFMKYPPALNWELEVFCCRGIKT